MLLNSVKTEKCGLSIFGLDIAAISHFGSDLAFVKIVYARNRSKWGYLRERYEELTIYPVSLSLFPFVKNINLRSLIVLMLFDFTELFHFSECNKRIRFFRLI